MAYGYLKQLQTHFCWSERFEEGLTHLYPDAKEAPLDKIEYTIVEAEKDNLAKQVCKNCKCKTFKTTTITNEIIPSHLMYNTEPDEGGPNYQRFYVCGIVPAYDEPTCSGGADASHFHSPDTE